VTAPAGAARASAAWQVAVDDAPAAVAAGGRLLAVGGAAGTVWVIDAADRRPAATVTLPGGLLDLAFSPGGDYLALTGPQGHRLWRAADGRTMLGGSGRWSARARWAPGAEGAGPERVAVADGRAAVVLDADGRELWRTGDAASTVADLAWLRGGRRLAVAAYNGVRCHERHQPGPVASYSYVGSHLAVAVTPDSRWICTGNQDASIHIWRARDGVELTMSGYPGKVSRLAFDDTGRWLAADGAPEVTVWDFAGKGPEGRAARMLRAHDAVTALAWRPGDGATLATAGSEGTVALWNVQAGRPGRARTTTAGWDLDGEVTALAWNGPDMLLAATRGGMLHSLDPSQP
jgi:WD40 repeat protein